MDKCKECQKDVVDISKHIRHCTMPIQMYYDKYIKKEEK